jgi:hypothetical protein
MHAQTAQKEAPVHFYPPTASLKSATKKMASKPRRTEVFKSSGASAEQAHRPKSLHFLLRRGPFERADAVQTIAIRTHSLISNTKTKKEPK